MVLPRVDLLDQDLLHDVSELPEELSEVAREQGACHVETLLPIVVPVVLLNPAKVGPKKLVDHVAKEEALPLNIVWPGGDMREQLALEEELSVGDSVFLDERLGTTSLGDVVKSFFLTVDDVGFIKRSSEDL